MNDTPARTGSAAVLDTSVAIDFYKSKPTRQAVSSILDEYSVILGTSIGLLEFKATLIQEMITIHGELVKARKFTQAHYRLVESMHRQARLRAHIFHTIIGVFARGPSLGLSDADDERLADEARLKLEVDIPEIYHEFRNEVLTSVLDGRVGCDRAAEAPYKSPKRKTFDTNLPKCKRGKNKTCRVEEVIRTRALPLLEAVVPQAVKDTIGDPDQVPSEFGQLCSSLALARAVASNLSIDLTSGQCRNCGDALIVAEAQGIATHGLSTNAKDWRPLCDRAGIEFHHVQPKEF